MPNSTRLCVLLLGLAYGGYIYGDLFQGTRAVDRQKERFKTAVTQRNADMEHVDAVACGLLPLDDLTVLAAVPVETDTDGASSR